MLPRTHVDLLDRPLPAVLTTEMPDGSLQSTVVWYNTDGDDLLLNTMREFQKARNLRARPRATLLVMEPDGGGRWMEVRATATMEDEGALAHLDELAVRYTGRAPYFGAVVDAGLASVEHPVRVRLTPHRVVVGPIRHPARSKRADAGQLAGTGAVDPFGVDAICAGGDGDGAHDGCATEPRIPDTHRDLLDRPIVAVLSTRLPDGFAQVNPVWCALSGNDVLANTTLERQKGRNLAADRRGTVLVVDPADSSRWIEIRARACLIRDGAIAQLDELTLQYTGHRHFYGSVYPEERRHQETRVTVRLHPCRVNCDAVHR